ncbi:hypothetical protein BD289DRAFT_253456 [Coniella lustricola]|uniref:Box C/D snoRNA protein 1 n=1 Tax=Coniella lustricola TaxID=2025994 RepID=A0A2T3A8B3_9PEZI|nr:hypothetical protein BD289DRAFT_253456 [Coniella lustricola]
MSHNLTESPLLFPRPPPSPRTDHNTMADPLLSTLCSICHTVVPKYTCPACHAQTCSLPCSQKHKAWANCTGKRDPTAFMPAAQLKTPAGVDHDYNFLSSIERERDRNQRELVEDRGLFSDKQLRELSEEKRWRKMWFGEEVRFVSAGAGSSAGGQIRGFGSDGEDNNNSDDGDDDKDAKNPAAVAARRAHSALARRVRQRLDQANVEVVHMPLGMSRQRENTTAWNRKAQRINWCVEWIVHEATTQSPAPSKRIRHKALETTPLYKALGNSLSWQRKGQKKEEDDDEDDEDVPLSLYARKRRRILIKEVKEEGRRTAMQDAALKTWQTTPYMTQNPYTAAWNLDRSAAISSWLPDEAIDEKKHHRFYLLKPLTPLGKPKELIPLGPTDTLGRALTGRTVLEYPTIYVLPPSSAIAGEHELPEGFILGSPERRVREKNPKPEKRKAGDNKGVKSQPPNKHRAVGEDGLSMRGGRSERGRGRGRGGVRGRGGGRFQQQHNERENAAAAAAADTSSSDPDNCSDEEGELHSDTEFEDREKVDAQQINPSTKPSSLSARAAAPDKPTLGLLAYGSDSDDEEGSGNDDEGEDFDVAGLKPENPELVASAIQEIVGLLS